MSDIGAEVRIWAIPVATLFIVAAVTWATVGWPVASVPLLLALLAAVSLVALNLGRVQGWWEEQQDPERRTARLLHSLRRGGYRVLHSRGVRGSDTPLDHLVIGPTGVFALTSRRFHRQVPMRTMHKDLYHGPQSQRSILDRAARQAGYASEILSNSVRHDIRVTPTVVIHGPHVPWKVLSIRGVDVLSGRRLRRYMTRRQRQLGAVEIERITTAAEEAFPAPSDVAEPYAARTAK